MVTLSLDPTIIENNNTYSIRANFDNPGIISIKADSFSADSSDYAKKYFFIDVYFDANVPTSVAISVNTDVSNYLKQSITEQFSGQAFKANSWNTLAIDLAVAPLSGVINGFNYFVLDFTVVAAGNYYISDSYLRMWTIMDFWYYSKNTIIASGDIIASKSQFMDANNQYNLNDLLVGEEEWIDVIMYDAIFNGLSDKESEAVKGDVLAKRKAAWEEFQKKYPDMVPLIVTQDYNFESDYLANQLYNSFYGDIY